MLDFPLCFRRLIVWIEGGQLMDRPVAASKISEVRNHAVSISCPELRYTQAELEQYLPQISEEPAAPAGQRPKGRSRAFLWS